MKPLTDDYNFNLASESGNYGFETLRNPEDGNYYFLFNDKSGKTFLFSEGYPVANKRDKGLQSVIQNAANENRYEFGEDGGKRYFILKAGNHQEIARSRMFGSQAEMDSHVQLLKGMGENPPVNPRTSSATSAPAPPTPQPQAPPVQQQSPVKPTPQPQGPPANQHEHEAVALQSAKAPAAAKSAAVTIPPVVQSPVEEGSTADALPRYRFTIDVYPESKSARIEHVFSQDRQEVKNLTAEEISQFIKSKLPQEWQPAITEAEPVSQAEMSSTATGSSVEKLKQKLGIPETASRGMTSARAASGVQGQQDLVETFMANNAVSQKQPATSTTRSVREMFDAPPVVVKSTRSAELKAMLGIPVNSARTVSRGTQSISPQRKGKEDIVEALFQYGMEYFTQVDDVPAVNKRSVMQVLNQPAGNLSDSTGSKANTTDLVANFIQSKKASKPAEAATVQRAAVVHAENDVVLEFLQGRESAQSGARSAQVSGLGFDLVEAFIKGEQVVVDDGKSMNKAKSVVRAGAENRGARSAVTSANPVANPAAASSGDMVTRFMQGERPAAAVSDLSGARSVVTKGAGASSRSVTVENDVVTQFMKGNRSATSTGSATKSALGVVTANLVFEQTLVKTKSSNGPDLVDRFMKGNKETASLNPAARSAAAASQPAATAKSASPVDQYIVSCKF